jgi:hypothetical protein
LWSALGSWCRSVSSDSRSRSCWRRSSSTGSTRRSSRPFTHLDLSGYQQYDKALDVYYLSLAYLATFRNWVSRDGFDVSRFLFYYRLVGVVLFEQTQIRAILLIFPNTFEYFFDTYEAIRTRWDPRRLARNLLIGIAAFIWIFIKLPQEWWIHVAELDATDLIKTRIFGVSKDASWTDAIANAPWVLPVVAVVVIGLVVAAWWVVTPGCHRPITASRSTPTSTSRWSRGTPSIASAAGSPNGSSRPSFSRRSY